jgi:glycosyltransferase involved in cell wall biosynthesis
MDELIQKKIVYVSIVDWFFISHRLPLAEEGIKRGNKVFLITKNTCHFDYLKQKGICCININFSRSGRNLLKEFITVVTLFKIYFVIKPDIIHHIGLKTTFYGSIASLFTSRKIKIINAITGLGYIYTVNDNLFSRNVLTFFLKLLYKLKKCFFIFQNPDDFNFFNSLKILNNNYVIIKGAGVDPKLFKQKSNYKNTNRIRIVLVARMLRDKGIIEFIKAANLLKEKYYSKAEFILVGGIDLKNPSCLTELEIEKFCDNNYIKWLGHQTDIKSIYTNSDIVCLPSYREGLPKSLIEAMAIGCPIITTNTVGCKECVIDGENGFLVPIYDFNNLSLRIEQLINDENLRMEMGIKSRKKMENEMTLSVVIESTFNFYNL